MGGYSGSAVNLFFKKKQKIPSPIQDGDIYGLSKIPILDFYFLKKKNILKN
jgi:hypothetical protein